MPSPSNLQQSSTAVASSGSHEPSPEAPRRASPALRELDSYALFGSASEVLIRHDAMLYRLRKTGQGKLILTK